MATATDELAKIDQYFAEGARLWENDPEYVLSREYFELWEQTLRPCPFAVSGDRVSIAGSVIQLVPDSRRTAYVSWDADEQRVALCLEGATASQRVMLMFEDGMPHVAEYDPVFREEAGICHGERLEMVYDILARLREERPNRHVVGLPLKEYQRALAAIADRYDASAVRVMRQLNKASMDRLVRKAAEDMALDELSNQLALPLDGTYAAGPSGTEDSTANQHTGRGVTVTIPGATSYAVDSMLQVLLLACSEMIELEATYILPLGQAELLSSGEGDEAGAADASPAQGEIRKPEPFWLKVACDPDVPIREGEKLPVIHRAQGWTVGSFVADIYEGPYVYGRLFPKDNMLVDDATDPMLYVRPLQSSTRLLARVLSDLLEEFRRDRRFRSRAMNAVFGVEDFTFAIAGHSAAPEPLDASQSRAWSAAANPENPVVVIQGPPGTGKTALLEQVIRTLCAEGRRVLISAPSNTAVDNMCRRVLDLPVLRFGKREGSIAPDVANACWGEDLECIRTFAERRKEAKGGIFAGTHVGLVKSEIVHADIDKNGLFDVIVFDEAGMSGADAFVPCLALADRAVLFGDHQQLPPFPMPKSVVESVDKQMGPLPESLSVFIHQSPLEWFVNCRGVPPILLQACYRCQNPRLMRFSSTLFYNARVRTSDTAEYYRLSYLERQEKYPPSTLRLFRTSDLPEKLRSERFVLSGNRPGLENPLEARICLHVFRDLLARYPLEEITVIAPYRRQMRLLRKLIGEFLRSGDSALEEELVEQFIFARIATVDSFQGGESDAVLITYVRSNDGTGIGFVDDPNRVNVAHTRARREMVIVGDIDCLAAQARNEIFKRLARAVRRDGEMIDVTVGRLAEWGIA